MANRTDPRIPELRRIAIDADADERLDALLARRLDLSRSRAAALIEDGRVRLAGATVRKSHRPRAGECFVVELPPEPSVELRPEPIPVPVVYEDGHLLVVDKPAGLVVHPAPGHPSGTLVNALLHITDRLSPLGLPHRPGIVHRLDRDTSGLLVVAKDAGTHRALSEALARRRVKRGYVAAAWGRFEPELARIDAPIGRHPRDRTRMAVVDGGRPAVSHVRRLERWAAADLLAVRLQTGRTHQIRVHLAHSGHPVVGDPLYGGDRERGLAGAADRWARELRRRCGRMFLHAARLEFVHPASGERLRFTSRLPEPLASALTWARGEEADR
ncbi:MAG: RluA family pseudouridine synthase [Gemmatimonadota bacterium]|nr:RluA family pseudouridine synthase [Gemmatimonadota bacterium]